MQPSFRLDGIWSFPQDNAELKIKSMADEAEIKKKKRKKNFKNAPLPVLDSKPVIILKHS